MKTLQKSNFQFYATLLDSFQNYLDAETLWEQFYGGSEDPKISFDDYCDQAKQELIDRINRVPFESEAADRGTCFNEVVDCVIAGKNTEREDMEITQEGEGVVVKFKEQEFRYPKALVWEVANLYPDAVSQYKAVGVLPTKYGNVTLYGYIDELMPTCVHDIKTTKNYSAFKFRDHWQHRVYPYCLAFAGVNIGEFRYDVVKWGAKGIYELFSEHYTYDPERDNRILTSHTERLIEFLLLNKDKITDKKIFNQLEGQDEYINSLNI